MRILWQSPTVRTVAIYAVSGLGFVGANLVLARVLPTDEYGLFTLVIALVNLGFALAPAGIDGIVNRRHLDPGPQLLRRTMVATTLVGIGLTILAEIAYELSLPTLLVLFVSTVTGGAMAVAGAQFQSERRFGISLALTQSPNLALLVAAAAPVVTGDRMARVPLLISTVGFVLAAVVGWWMLFTERATKQSENSWFPWREALSLAGVNASGLLLVQLDRLIIPHVLTVHDLATYGVLAAVAGSLFRVLQMSVGYTLVPRLRAADSVLERRRLIAHEAKLVGGFVVAGSTVIWFVTPLIEQWFLQGKYHLGGSLLLAALISGVAKVMNAFARSTVTALATPAEVSRFNLFGWAAVGLAIPAALLGARWGLAGVVYGVALGWLIRALSCFVLVARHLRLPAPLPATAR